MPWLLPTVSSWAVQVDHWAFLLRTGYNSNKQSDTLAVIIMGPRRRFRIGMCSRIMAVAALFWLFMQLALVPHGKGSVGPLKNRDSPRRILYVHIGKTAGKWVKSQLAVTCKTRKNPKLKKSCLEYFQKNEESQISKQTVGYMHTGDILFPRNDFDLASHYLFSVRNPLSRFVSWYVYNHPKSCDPRESNSPSCKKNEWKKSLFECFSTLDDFGSSDKLVKDPLCSRILWDGWLGRVSNVKDPNHLAWNYQYYWNQTLSKSPNKSVLVVRQERLQEDMNNLEVFLGGTISNKQSIWLPSDTRDYLSGRVKSFISPEGKGKLCCMLQDEFEIYFSLIQKAENLSQEEKKATTIEALKSCNLGEGDSFATMRCTDINSPSLS